MIEVKTAWRLDVQRGPDWLFVRVYAADAQWGDMHGLAEDMWNMMQQHFTNRLVLELDHGTLMSSSLMGELMRLYKRVQSSGGLLRLAGLSDANRDVLRLTRLDRCFPHYCTREEAVMGIRSNW